MSFNLKSIIQDITENITGIFEYPLHILREIKEDFMKTAEYVKNKSNGEIETFELTIDYFTDSLKDLIIYGDYVYAEKPVILQKFRDALKRSLRTKTLSVSFNLLDFDLDAIKEKQWGEVEDGIVSSVEMFLFRKNPTGAKKEVFDQLFGLKFPEADLKMVIEKLNNNIVNLIKVLAQYYIDDLRHETNLNQIVRFQTKVQNYLDLLFPNRSLDTTRDLFVATMFILVKYFKFSPTNDIRYFSYGREATEKEIMEKDWIYPTEISINIQSPKIEFNTFKKIIDQTNEYLDDSEVVYTNSERLYHIEDGNLEQIKQILTEIINREKDGVQFLNGIMNFKQDQTWKTGQIALIRGFTKKINTTDVPENQKELASEEMEYYTIFKLSEVKMRTTPFSYILYPIEFDFDISSFFTIISDNEFEIKSVSEIFEDIKQKLLIKFIKDVEAIEKQKEITTDIAERKPQGFELSSLRREIDDLNREAWEHIFLIDYESDDRNLNIRFFNNIEYFMELTEEVKRFFIETMNLKAIIQKKKFTDAWTSRDLDINKTIQRSLDSSMIKPMQTYRKSQLESPPNFFIVFDMSLSMLPIVRTAQLFSLLIMSFFDKDFNKIIVGYITGTTQYGRKQQYVREETNKEIEEVAPDNILEFSKESGDYSVNVQNLVSSFGKHFKSEKQNFQAFWNKMQRFVMDDLIDASSDSQKYIEIIREILAIPSGYSFTLNQLAELISEDFKEIDRYLSSLVDNGILFKGENNKYDINFELLSFEKSRDHNEKLLEFFYKNKDKIYSEYELKGVIDELMNNSIKKDFSEWLNEETERRIPLQQSISSTEKTNKKNELKVSLFDSWKNVYLLKSDDNWQIADSRVRNDMAKIHSDQLQSHRVRSLLTKKNWTFLGEVVNDYFDYDVAMRDFLDNENMGVGGTAMDVFTLLPLHPDLYGRGLKYILVVTDHRVSGEEKIEFVRVAEELIRREDVRFFFLWISGLTDPLTKFAEDNPEFHFITRKYIRKTLDELIRKEGEIISTKEIETMKNINLKADIIFYQFVYNFWDYIYIVNPSNMRFVGEIKNILQKLEDQEFFIP